MAQLEANSTQIAPELEGEGGEDRLQGNRNQGSGEPNLNARIKHAQKLAAKTSRDKFELNKALTKKTCDRSRLKEPNKHERRLKYCLAAAREKMNILQLFLLHFASRAHQGNPMKPSLPREEIAKHVRVLAFGTIPRVSEKAKSTLGIEQFDFSFGTKPLNDLAILERMRDPYDERGENWRVSIPEKLRTWMSGSKKRIT